MVSVQAQLEKETWVLMWAHHHHPQEEPERSGAMWIRWQSKAGALVVRSLVVEAKTRTWNITSLRGRNLSLGDTS